MPTAKVSASEEGCANVWKATLRSQTISLLPRVKMGCQFVNQSRLGTLNGSIF